MYARYLLDEWAHANPRVRYPILFAALLLLWGIAGGIDTGALLP